MSDAEKVRHLVTNHQNQPIELYLPSGLIVLPPRGRAELVETDLAAPQLEVLRASRLVSLDEIAVAPKAEDAEETAKAEEAAEAEEETREAVPEGQPKSGSKS